MLYFTVFVSWSCHFHFLECINFWVLSHTLWISFYWWELANSELCLTFYIYIVCVCVWGGGGGQMIIAVEANWASYLHLCISNLNLGQQNSSPLLTKFYFMDNMRTLWKVHIIMQWQQKNITSGFQADGIIHFNPKVFVTSWNFTPICDRGWWNAESNTTSAR